MSLYGTGRSEGIGATFLIAAIVLVVQLVGAWARPQTTDLELLARICVPALGGALCYRFLRAQGRSRYAGFLVGIAYGLSLAIRSTRSRSPAMPTSPSSSRASSTSAQISGRAA